MNYFIVDPETRRRAVNILLTYVILGGLILAIFFSACWWAKEQARGITIVPREAPRD